MPPNLANAAGADQVAIIGSAITDNCSIGFNGSKSRIS
jgi:hypothetical protein